MERTFFGPGSSIEGTLHIEGDAKVEGQVQGKIIGTGTITVGEQARIDADIHAPTVVVEGTVRGEISSSDRLELHRSAKIQGSLKAPRLRIDEGALFEGECKMSAAQGSAPTK